MADRLKAENVPVLLRLDFTTATDREADMPVQISHLKAAGKPNWGKVADALALIDAARAEKLDVLCDAYPYMASSTSDSSSPSSKRPRSAALPVPGSRRGCLAPLAA